MFIDGIHINHDHFGAMEKQEAIRRMIADGFVPGNTDKQKERWAGKAYQAIKKNQASGNVKT